MIDDDVGKVSVVDELTTQAGGWSYFETGIFIAAVYIGIYFVAWVHQFYCMSKYYIETGYLRERDPYMYSLLWLYFCCFGMRHNQPDEDNWLLGIYGPLVLALTTTFLWPVTVSSTVWILLVVNMRKKKLRKES